MALDFARFCEDYNITTAQEGEKHVREGWTQVVCPFCTGSEGYHLGYNDNENYFNCYRCGWHSNASVLWKLSGGACTKENITRYLGREVDPNEEWEKPHARVCVLPKGTHAITVSHKRYLRGRGYVPRALVETWGVLGTVDLSPYEWRWQVIIPVKMEGVLHTFQGRKIVETKGIPYTFCSDKDSVTPAKDLVYGVDQVRGHAIVIVEGVFDAWKLGPGAVCTFGVGFTDKQVARLGQYNRKYIMYDNDTNGAGQRAARRLASRLDFGYTEIVQLPPEYKDPGKLPLETGRTIMRNLLGPQGGYY